VVSVEPCWIILGAVILGGIFGLFQIPVWQGCVTVGIIVGRMLLTWGQGVVIGWVNRLYVMSRFALQGGLTSDDPGTLLAELRRLPPLVGTDKEVLRLMVGLFSLLVTCMYLFGRWRFRIRPRPFGPLLIYEVSPVSRLLACGLGAINGYLIIHSLAPFLLPQTETVVKVPSGQLISLLDRNLIPILIGFALITIVIGLQASGQSED